MPSSPSRPLSLLSALVCLVCTWGCAQERPPINRVQANALAKSFAPMAFAGLGVASFDVRTDSGITLNTGQSGIVQLWQTNGPFFVMAGGGVRFLVADMWATSLALRVNGSFGANGFIPSFAPELSTAIGF